MTDKENKEKRKQRVSWEHVVLVAVFVAVFLGVFLYYKFFDVKEQSVYGVKVFSVGTPRDAIRAALAGNKTVIEVRTLSEASESNSYLSFMAADVSWVVASTGRKVAVFARTPDGSLLNGTCTEETNYCLNPNVIIAIDACNCLKAQNGQLQVLFDEKSIADAKLRYAVRGVIGGALK